MGNERSKRVHKKKELEQSIKQLYMSDDYQTLLRERIDLEKKDKHLKKKNKVRYTDLLKNLDWYKEQEKIMLNRHNDPTKIIQSTAKYDINEKIDYYSFLTKSETVTKKLSNNKMSAKHYEKTIVDAIGNYNMVDIPEDLSLYIIIKSGNLRRNQSINHYRINVRKLKSMGDLDYNFRY